MLDHARRRACNVAEILEPATIGRVVAASRARDRHTMERSRSPLRPRQPGGVAGWRSHLAVSQPSEPPCRPRKARRGRALTNDAVRFPSTDNGAERRPDAPPGAAPRPPGRGFQRCRSGCDPTVDSDAPRQDGVPTDQPQARTRRWRCLGVGRGVGLARAGCRAVGSAGRVGRLSGRCGARTGRRLPEAGRCGTLPWCPPVQSRRGHGAGHAGPDFRLRWRDTCRVRRHARAAGGPRPVRAARARAECASYRILHMGDRPGPAPAWLPAPARWRFRPGRGAAAGRANDADPGRRCQIGTSEHPNR